MQQPVGLPVMTVKAYAEREGLRRQVVDEACRVNCGDPIVMAADGAGRRPAANLDYDFPEIAITEFDMAVARGRSNLLSGRDALLTHELMDLRWEFPGEHVLRRLGIAPDFARAAWIRNDASRLHTARDVAVFTDVTAPNYAHWLTEVLPRIATLVADPAHRRTPLVLDANLHENILRSVALIAPSNPVHLLAASDRLAVERLHHVSVAGYVPYQSRPRPAEQIHHGVFSPVALRRSIGMLREAVGAAADGGRPRILIRRGARYRRLVNEAEIEAALSARGFTCVATDDLTLDAQVALFSKARMVVGVAGAALANLVFCRPDCPIVVMQPKFQNMASWYWHRMAVAAGAGPVIHVSGPQVTAHPDPWHDRAAHQDYRVELTDLLEAIDAAEALGA